MKYSKYYRCVFMAVRINIKNDVHLSTACQTDIAVNEI